MEMKDFAIKQVTIDDFDQIFDFGTVRNRAEEP